jgi:AraC-like DNA-binding protein
MQIFGAPCHFQQPVSRIRFPSRYLSKRIVRRPADLETTLSYSTAPNPVEAESMPPTWRDGLKSILKKRLVRSTTMPTLEELAEEFGVCSQTLRRRLRAENYSYRMLKAETRREIALDGMRDDRLTLAQISLMAGFAETNGLVRAMKSWTGLTPSQYRRIATDQAEGEGERAAVERRPAADARSGAPIS